MVLLQPRGMAVSDMGNNQFGGGAADAGRLAHARNRALAARDRAAGLARDPEIQRKAKQVFGTAQELYKVASGPEARVVYRKVAQAVKETWKR